MTAFPACVQAGALATTSVIAPSVFVFLGLACGMPGALEAQARLEVAPYVGRYWPTSGLASEGGATVQQQPSVIRGTRVILWGPGRLGIEATVGYAPSAVGSSYGLTYPAHVWTASAKARLRMTPPAARAAFQVAGGVGFVGHGGYAYPPWYDGPWTFLGGIASVSAIIKLIRWVGVRFDAEDFAYFAHLGRCERFGSNESGVCDVYAPSSNSLQSTSSRLQNDLVLSIGIAFACCPWGSRSQ